MSIYIRERPICRKVIIELGLRPHLDENGKWDRRSVDPEGQIDRLSDGMRKQMRLMISEGCWDDSPSATEPNDEHPIICKCGMARLPHALDDVYHRNYHDEFVNGVRVPTLPDDEVVHEERGIRILVVRPKSPLKQRRRAEKVAARVNREMALDFGIYHVTDTENIPWERHVLMACEGDRAVGFLLVQKRSVRDEAQQVRDRWIAFVVWVLEKCRRRGIAAMLLKAAGRSAPPRAAARGSTKPHSRSSSKPSTPRSPSSPSKPSARLWACCGQRSPIWNSKGSSPGS